LLAEHPLNLFGGFALFFVLAVAIYFLWRWVRTTSLYAILFDTRSLEPTPDKKMMIIGTGVPPWKVTENLKLGLYPRSEYKNYQQEQVRNGKCSMQNSRICSRAKGQRPKSWN
jgi:hypothetical protein